MTIDTLLEVVKSYNEEEVERVKKAYDYANMLHAGQYRQSGEPYITHPLNVAYILATMHADRDTVCAGLLHDTLEDTNTTKEDIAELFGKTVSNLVDGVTKISKMNFSTKEEQNLANIRKIFTSITYDIRIIFIKVADRLHNMRTMEYKSTFKQKENSLETIELYVPLAYHTGMYCIKNELEDLSLRYLKPDMYQRIVEKRNVITEESKPYLEEMSYKIGKSINDIGIPNEIKSRIKNNYGIYKKLSKGSKISDIHDLLALKIMVKEVEDCYRCLYSVHKEYRPINEKFKDYICNPKTNKYQSLHTTVFGPDERLVQTQIRTFEMEEINSFGLIAYWNIANGNARDTMQEEIRNKYQFFKLLSEISTTFSDNYEFVKQVKEELFAGKVYIYSSTGNIVELPIGSTIIDYAYQLGDEIAETMVLAKVNEEYVPLNYVLQNKDRVKIITDDLSFGPREDWINIAKTSYAKKRILEFNNK